MIKYGIIGAGWRSEFYLRLANLVPEKFSVSGIYIRNPEKRKVFSEKYNVKIFDNLKDLLSTEFDFIVSCVNKEAINQTAQMLSDKGVYILSETPVASAQTATETATDTATETSTEVATDAAQ